MIVNIGSGTQVGQAQGGIGFGVTVAEGNKYFDCGSECGWGGYSNHKDYGCQIRSTGEIQQCSSVPKIKAIQTNDQITCRLDLINDKLSFKVNDGEYVAAPFDGFQESSVRKLQCT